MNQQIGQIALVVKDYDEAIEWYTTKLGFVVVEDTALSDIKRWVVIKPQGEGGCALLLAKSKNESELHAVGNQTGGRVFLFLYTDDLERDYKTLIANNVKIIIPLREESYGKLCLFSDLYGNIWDFIERKQ